MSQLKAVKLYGALTSFSTEPLELDVSDMKDVVAALRSTFPTFRAFLTENPNFVIVLSERGRVNPRPITSEFFNTPFDASVEEVHLFPVVEGETGIEIAAIAAYLGTSVLIATIIVNIAVSLVLGAVISLLSPKPKTGGSERPAEKPSFIFNGPENVTEQGYQVPIVYGTHMTGSVVVSAGITVEQLVIYIPPTVVEPPPQDWQFDGTAGGDSGAGDGGDGGGAGAGP